MCKQILRRPKLSKYLVNYSQAYSISRRSQFWICCGGPIHRSKCWDYGHGNGEGTNGVVMRSGQYCIDIMLISYMWCWRGGAAGGVSSTSGKMMTIKSASSASRNHGNLTPASAAHLIIVSGWRNVDQHLLCVAYVLWNTAVLFVTQTNWSNRPFLFLQYVLTIRRHCSVSVVFLYALIYSYTYHQTTLKHLEWQFKKLCWSTEQ